jgi:hypothetical protein
MRENGGAGRGRDARHPFRPALTPEFADSWTRSGQHDHVSAATVISAVFETEIT